MASTNQSPQYQKAEAKFLSAQSDKEKLIFLEEMIRECPKHKSAEKMLAQLKTRYKKLKEKIEKSRKLSSKSGTRGIKKEDMQAVIIGSTNTGKSSLLRILTNAKPEIANIEAKFTTNKSIVGIMNYDGTNIQLVEIPAFGSEFYDKGLVNSADILLILITSLEQIKETEKVLSSSKGKRIIIFNKVDLFSENDKRKISSTLQSKKYNFILISTKTREGINELKNKIFKSFGKIRIFTKEPGKEKTEKPIILEKDATVRNATEKILHGFSAKVKETKIWGPSSKFPGQIVGLNHRLKDLDVVEFKTR